LDYFQSKTFPSVPTVNPTYQYSDLAGKIIHCAMKVHRALGNGFQEVIYQWALEIEMGDHDLKFAREFKMPIFYRERAIGTRRVDFLVDEKISVELKALSKLEALQLPRSLQPRNRPIDQLRSKQPPVQALYKQEIFRTKLTMMLIR
jgi:GxxExxY protein